MRATSAQVRRVATTIARRERVTLAAAFAFAGAAPPPDMLSFGLRITRASRESLRQALHPEALSVYRR